MVFYFTLLRIIHSFGARGGKWCHGVKGFICLFGGFIMVPMMGNRIVSEQVGAIGGMVFFFGILLLVIGFKMDKSV